MRPGSAAIALPPHAERTALLLTCKLCGHVWPALWFPADAARLNAMKPKSCPWCGATSKQHIFIAAPAAGDIDRYLAWLEAEIGRVRAMLATLAPSLSLETRPTEGHADAS
jgi:hypothetical protein